MTRCPLCRGKMAGGVATFTLERERTTLVLKEISATVCDQCGYTLFTEDVTRRALGMLDDAVSRGVQIEVTTFPNSRQLREAA